MVTGGLLSAYVITWYSALRHAPATVVTSLLVGAAVITGVLTAATAGKTPSPTVVAGLSPGPGWASRRSGSSPPGPGALRMHVATPRSPEPRRATARPRPSGPVLFARYAYSPNRLGLCGPDDAESLFGEATTGGDERELRRLAQGFEGAYPYLELIARANGLPDPLDARVVDAYWLGSPLLERVTPGLLADSLRSRFRAGSGRQPGAGWKAPPRSAASPSTRSTCWTCSRRSG